MGAEDVAETDRPRQRDYANANARAKRMRREPTKAEARLWRLLRGMEGYHFRRQVALGPYVFDFGDHGGKLLVEVDGGIHEVAAVMARDTEKDAWARRQGYTVVRIPNEHVFGTGEWALAAIKASIREC